MSVSEAVRTAQVVQMLLPDEQQAHVYKAEVEENLREGQMLLFSHGFNIHFGQINPPSYVDVAMVAPKARVISFAVYFKKEMVFRHWSQYIKMLRARHYV